jgi:hypothetical protein
VIFSGEVDLTQAAADDLVSISLPSGVHFFADSVGYVITAAAGVSVQPDISFGITGTSTQLLGSTTTTKNAQYGREEYTSADLDGQTSLTASLKTSATATTFTVRFYFKGICVED